MLKPAVPLSQFGLKVNMDIEIHKLLKYRVGMR